MKRKVILLLFAFIFVIGLPVGFSSTNEFEASSNLFIAEKASINEPSEEKIGKYQMITITILVLLIGAITRVWFLVYRKKKIRKGGN
ncbi:hypothetical protein [Ornithinibacillus sp. 179-J 7C1 HS]|uniref:hypothetical protein n=1 Tax=Ornithinibacillus sp. 179-J 7C1 HS TaxID=3142384 RepID=UPI0039A2B579